MATDYSNDDRPSPTAAVREYDTEPKLSDIDWSGPAADIRDDLVEVWFARHPEVGRDDRSFPDAEAWADDMFAKHAEPRADA